MKVAVLTGGVGGARFLRGIVDAVDPATVTAIVNVGDDLEVLGLSVSPDLDSVLYALAGLADDERGWGRADETWNALASVESLGGESWFRLGDRDLGLHFALELVELDDSSCFDELSEARRDSRSDSP